MPEMQRRVVDGRSDEALAALLQEHEHISRFKVRRNARAAERAER
jgi:hypothetical protein